MQLKTTRAFRTISEAGDELGLQPHVLRFWESKFPQIKPMKRGGGRRFYRPEDIEFLRGIKILLHDEKHPIKDVQKLIRVKGAGRILELGRSVERAAKPKPVEEVELIPKRIVKFEPAEPAEPDVPHVEVPPVNEADSQTDTVRSLAEVDNDVDDEILRPISAPPIPAPAKAKPPVVHSVELEGGKFVGAHETAGKGEYAGRPDTVIPAANEAGADDMDAAEAQMSDLDQTALREALDRLKALRVRWTEFQAKA